MKTHDFFDVAHLAYTWFLVSIWVFLDNSEATVEHSAGLKDAVLAVILRVHSL